MVTIKIEGKDTEFPTQAAADEAVAMAANAKAARTLLAAAVGGTKYRDEAFGLAIVRYCVEASFRDAKVKAKDITASAVFEEVQAVTDATLDNALDAARNIVSALATLTSKYQSPMKGGDLPKRVAEAFAVVVKPETGAAQRDTATTFIQRNA